MTNDVNMVPFPDCVGKTIKKITDTYEDGPGVFVSFEDGTCCALEAYDSWGSVSLNYDHKFDLRTWGSEAEAHGLLDPAILADYRAARAKEHAEQSERRERELFERLKAKYEN